MRGENFKSRMFRFGMNIYPMFFATGGRLLFLKADFSHAIVRLKLNLWTRNYVGTIFGGSMFSAADPFHMVLLINCIGKNYIVWDKSAKIDFKKPGKGTLKAEFIYTPEELKNITDTADKNGNYEFKKAVSWIDQKGEVVSTYEKVIYVATKEHFKKRQEEKAAAKNNL
jgi:hypothetical protein